MFYIPTTSILTLVYTHKIYLHSLKSLKVKDSVINMNFPACQLTNTITALIPKGPKAQHTLFAAGTISFSRSALAELLEIRQMFKLKISNTYV